MARTTKNHVRAILETLNEQIPPGSKIFKREIKADYYAAGGGWKFFYYDEFGRGRELNARRYNYREAIAFLRGIEFSFNNL